MTVKVRLQLALNGSFSSERGRWHRDLSWRDAHRRLGHNSVHRMENAAKLSPDVESLSAKHSSTRELMEGGKSRSAAKDNEGDDDEGPDLSLDKPSLVVASGPPKQRPGSAQKRCERRRGRLLRSVRRRRK